MGRYGLSFAKNKRKHVTALQDAGSRRDQEHSVWAQRAQTRYVWRNRLLLTGSLMLSPRAYSSRTRGVHFRAAGGGFGRYDNRILLMTRKLLCAPCARIRDELAFTLWPTQVVHPQDGTPRLWDMPPSENGAA